MFRASNSVSPNTSASSLLTSNRASARISSSARARMRAASSCALASNSAFKGSFSDMVHSFTGDEFAIVPRLSHVVNKSSTNSSAAHTAQEQVQELLCWTSPPEIESTHCHTDASQG